MNVLIATCGAFLDKQGKPLAKDDQLLQAALTARGYATRVASWDDPSVQWDEADIVLLRSTWDYFYQPQAFVLWIAYVQRVSHLYNPIDAVFWNLDKHYLQQLAEIYSVPVIPTSWLNCGKEYDIATIMQKKQWNTAVIKPTTGANSYKTFLFDMSQLHQAQQHLADIHASHTGAMLQPFLDIREMSHVFLNGLWSHAFVRSPFTSNQPDEQFDGGFYRADELPYTEIQLAQTIYRVLEQIVKTPLLYARVDLVSGVDGRKMLMEVEVIEPVLRLEFPGAVDRFIAGVLERATLAVTGSRMSRL